MSTYVEQHQLPRIDLTDERIPRAMVAISTI